MTHAVVIDLRELLQAKVSALTQEARITRRAEKKATGFTRECLRTYRLCEVRYQARHACLVLGLLKGRSWRQMEPVTKTPPDWCEVERLLHSYGPTRWSLQYEGRRDARLHRPGASRRPLTTAHGCDPGEIERRPAAASR